MVLDEELHAELIKKRKLTTIAFAIQNVFLGCEYGIFVVNLWLYIIEIVKPDKPKLYYSLISVSYLLSTVAFSIFVSKYADQSRNIQKIFFMSNTALTLGNIIYMIPFSPWMLLVGRIIIGAGQPQRSVISGELARSYSHDDITYYIFAIMGTANGFGFMAAPGINILFSFVDIWFGTWHITYTNVSGFYMATFFVISQIMTIFMVYDLSKEYDFKDEIESTNKLVNNESYCSDTASVGATEETFLLTREKRTGQINTSFNYENKPRASVTSDDSEAMGSRSGDDEITVKSLLKKLFTRYDTALILGLTFCETFLVVSFDMCLPILVVGTLKWSIKALNIILLAAALVAILPGIIFTFRIISDRTIFYLSFVTFLAYGIIQVIQMLWAINNSNMTFNIFLSALYCLLFAGIVIIRDAFLCGFLAKMVSSRFQSLTDGIRVVISRVGAIAALSSAPYALEKIEIIGVVYICIILTFGCLLIFRQKTMSQPRIII